MSLTRDEVQALLAAVDDEQSRANPLGGGHWLGFGPRSMYLRWDDLRELCQAWLGREQLRERLCRIAAEVVGLSGGDHPVISGSRAAEILGCSVREARAMAAEAPAVSVAEALDWADDSRHTDLASCRTLAREVTRLQARVAELERAIRPDPDSPRHSSGLQYAPCPFCGERKSLVVEHGGGKDVWWVHCNKCEADGPLRGTAPGAITSWTELRVGAPGDCSEPPGEPLDSVEREVATAERREGSK